jgi:hypothetical protein
METDTGMRHPIVIYFYYTSDNHQGCPIALNLNCNLLFLIPPI